jgi:lysophospholipase L1-like esterase
MVFKVKKFFGYDDSLDAFGVHGIGGTMGALLTGLLASGAINAAYGKDAAGHPLATGAIDGNWHQVVNQAVGGLSSRTYLTQGHWDRVLAMMKKGDFVMMQFGHNDGGAVNDAARARGSLPGLGAETQKIDNLLTKQHEVVHTYGWYLRKFISDAQAKGATPLVCSLIPRQTWKDGRIVRSRDSYAGWAAQAAQAAGAAFIDLNEIIASRYDELGPAKTATLFVEGPHTNAQGAELNAQCVIAGLKALPDDPLAPCLRAATP